MVDLGCVRRRAGQSVRDLTPLCPASKISVCVLTVHVVAYSLTLFRFLATLWI